jgi:hypothetical protein
VARFRHVLANLAVGAFLLLSITQAVHAILTMEVSAVPHGATRHHRVIRYVIPEVTSPRPDSETSMAVSHGGLIAADFQDPHPHFAVQNTSEAPFWQRRRILVLCPIRSSLPIPAH